MNNLSHKACFLLIFLFSISSVFAQFGGQSGNSQANGLVGVAGAAKPARVITVGGRLTPYRKIVHSFSVDGYVDALLVKTGDRVLAGSSLMRITRDVIGETYRPVILESRIDGVVSKIHVYEKEEVSQGQAAVIVIDDSSYLLKVSLSDRDALVVRDMGLISVQGTSPEGVVFSGKIQEITTEPDYTTGLFTLTVLFPRNRGLYLGSVLFVDLPVQKASGIAIDRSALIREGKTVSIWVLNEEKQLEKRSIVTGDFQDDKITVSQGIASGERFIRKPGGLEKEGMTIRELVQANMAGGAGAEIQ